MTSAQTPFVVPRLVGTITLDGHIDETAWEAVAPLPLVTHWPTFGQVPSERTEIRVAYDDTYIYISCRCYAPPASVFAASFERDYFASATDYLAIGLDTYNDNESSVGFWTTPTGSRTDGTTSGDTGDMDISWNTFWDARVTMTPAGWFAEMRIPFSSLRFQSENGRVVMGLNAWRYMGKKNELTIFPAMPPEWGYWSFNKPSQFQKVVFEGINTRRPVYVAPYALGGLGQSYGLNEAETAYLRDDDLVTEVGGDIKLGLTDNLTLDLTVNTDFAQVEADNPQVNLTRFSLFFPEKRQFFLERASLFDFDLGSSNRLFYSRRIGLNGGEAVRLLGGGRAVGRIGAWDVGMINLQTARVSSGREPDDILPSENFGVLRLRRQAFNQHSTVGGLVTSRVGDDGTYNIAYGLDGDVRLGENMYTELRWAQTFDDDVDGTSLIDGARIRALVESRSYIGYGYAVKVERAGRDYRPDVGFEQRQDFTVTGAKLWRGWGQKEGSPLSRHQVLITNGIFFRNTDGSVETVQSTASWEGVFTTGAEVNIDTDVTFDDLREGFSLSDDADVPANSYTFAFASINVDTPGGKPMNAGFNAGGGTFYDGWRVNTGISPEWVVSKHLTVSSGYEFNRIAFPDRGQTFTAHVGTFRVRAALNTQLSLSSFLQINSAGEVGLANVRFRFNPSEGKDLYIVFNTGFYTDRLRTPPVQPFTSNRTVVVKYTHTFAL